MSTDVAIIGAGGFVGSRLIESTVLAGQAPVVAVVRSYRNLAGLCRFGSAVAVRLADAEKAGPLSEALVGARVVVNLTTGPGAGIVRSTIAIHEACRLAGVARLVHLSSAVVYGDVKTPVSDDAPPVEKHWMPYARAKATSEIWLRERGETIGPEVIVLRPGIVWGVRSPHTAGFARSLCRKNAFLVDGGVGIFNGIFIDNLVAAIRVSCEARGNAAGFYNIGDTETITWGRFFEALGRPLGCEVSRLPSVSGETFPLSIRSAFDSVQSLPLFDDLYHWLKTRVPETFKTGIKARLEGNYGYERRASSYVSEPSVDRELWSLQRVRHKLPITKFGARFGFVPPVSFDEGIGKTVAWLGTIGATTAGSPR